MTEPNALQRALQRNRQRLAFDRLAAKAPWLLAAIADVLAADASHQLDSDLRASLGHMRPEERGELVVTSDSAAFSHAIQQYFDSRRGIRFCVFLAHFVDAGALILDGAYLGHNLPAILELDGDTVYGCEEERGHVFAADRTVDDGRVTYEFFRFDKQGSHATADPI